MPTYYLFKLLSFMQQPQAQMNSGKFPYHLPNVLFHLSKIKAKKTRSFYFFKKGILACCKVLVSHIMSRISQEEILRKQRMVNCQKPSLEVCPVNQKQGNARMGNSRAWELLTLWWLGGFTLPVILPAHTNLKQIIFSRSCGVGYFLLHDL